jgi:dipeptidase D
MINMDSEEMGSIYVGCAGGSETTLTLPAKFQKPKEDLSPVQVKLTGLRGGHSGVDIHEQRGNAIKILARVLNAVLSSTKFHLADFTGGSKRNAIPRDAQALIAIDASNKAGFVDEIKKCEKSIKEEFQPMEPELRVELEENVEMPANVFEEVSQNNLLNFLDSLPHGVLAMSYSIPDLVETSTNLATVSCTEDEVNIGMLNRSSVDSSMKAIEQQLVSHAGLVGAKAEHSNFYPGWKANLDSNVLKTAQAVHKEMFGQDAEVKAIHAGLETGIIGVKFPGMDMISVGPQIEHPHSPEERVKISTVESFWKFVVAIIEQTART